MLRYIEIDQKVTQPPPRSDDLAIVLTGATMTIKEESPVIQNLAEKKVCPTGDTLTEEEQRFLALLRDPEKKREVYQIKSDPHLRT